MMMGYGMGWVGMLLQFVLLFAIVYFLVSFSKQRSLFEKGPSNSKEAQEILRERFAKGEITEEEYEHMKKVLLK